MCANDTRCGAFGAVSPIGCEPLTSWIQVLAKEEMDPSGEA